LTLLGFLDNLDIGRETISLKWILYIEANTI